MILSEIENYFMNLYSSKTDVSEEHFSSYVKQLEVPRLSHEMSLKAEGLLTYEECNFRFLQIWQIPWRRWLHSWVLFNFFLT